MLIGYARSSRTDGRQFLDTQRDALEAVGVATSSIYEDMAPISDVRRLGLEACLKALRPQDTLVVWRLDRLGLSLKHLVATLDELRTRGVGFRVLVAAGGATDIDTTSEHGRLVFAAIEALAEFERELLAERTRVGLTDARARAQGRLGRGRPRKMTAAMVRTVMTAIAEPRRRDRQLCTIGALLTAEHSTVGVTEVRTFRNEVTLCCSGFSDFDGLTREGLVCEEACP